MKILFILFVLQVLISCKDFYKILGVPKTASEKEIKQAYRNLAKKWHPDRHRDKDESMIKHAEEKYIELTEAYETLIDKDERKYYDMYGTTRNDQQGGMKRGNPHTGSTFHFGGSGFSFSFGTGGRGGSFFSSSGWPRGEENKRSRAESGVIGSRELHIIKGKGYFKGKNDVIIVVSYRSGGFFHRNSYKSVFDHIRMNLQEYSDYIHFYEHRPASDDINMFLGGKIKNYKESNSGNSEIISKYFLQEIIEFYRKKLRKKIHNVNKMDEVIMLKKKYENEKVIVFYHQGQLITQQELAMGKYSNYFHYINVDVNEVGSNGIKIKNLPLLEFCSEGRNVTYKKVNNLREKLSKIIKKKIKVLNSLPSIYKFEEICTGKKCIILFEKNVKSKEKYRELKKMIEDLTMVSEYKLINVKKRPDVIFSKEVLIEINKDISKFKHILNRTKLETIQLNEISQDNFYIKIRYKSKEEKTRIDKLYYSLEMSFYRRFHIKEVLYSISLILIIYIVAKNYQFISNNIGITLVVVGFIYMLYKTVTWGYYVFSEISELLESETVTFSF